MTYGDALNWCKNGEVIKTYNLEYLGNGGGDGD